jgi:hypothetical protein
MSFRIAVSDNVPRRRPRLRSFDAGGGRAHHHLLVSLLVTVLGNRLAEAETAAAPAHLYSGFFTDPATTRREERVKLLTTPFAEYEDSLREDMTRIFGPYAFNWDRDVSAVYLYRWGHGMVVPSHRRGSRRIPLAAGLRRRPVQPR